MNINRNLTNNISFVFIFLILVILNTGFLNSPYQGSTINTDTASSPIPINELQITSVILNEPEYTKKVIDCLNELSNTGASNLAMVKTHLLLNKLDQSPQEFAKPLVALLSNILALRNENEVTPRFTKLIPTKYPEISIDLIYRAAASCSERGRMKTTEIILSFAGDCTFGTINEANDKYSFPVVYRASKLFNYPFDMVKPWFFTDDLTVINYEGTLTKAWKTAKKKWKFRGPARYAKILPAASVELVSIANNHSFDYLEKGFQETRNNFNSEKVGVFYQDKPYVTVIKGIQIVIIGDCTVENENKTVTAGVAERVIKQITTYKKPENIVIVVMH